MKLADIVRLLILAAIWGGSFIFIKVLAPVFGPILTADLRVLIGGFSLLLYLKVTKATSEWRRFWKQYLVIGIVNSAIPFALYGFAALYLPASYSAILNATSPLFAAFFSIIWLQEKLTIQKGIGLLIGFIGVVLFAGFGPLQMNLNTLLAILTCLLAAMCYALAGVYTKKFAKDTKPAQVATYSQICAGLVLIPLIPFFPIHVSVHMYPVSILILSILGLALICSALAYVLYYQLLKNAGTIKALSVAFLIPVFGMGWSILFLKESVSVSMLLGCGFIFLGMGLVLNMIRFSTDEQIR